jgi:hypothetical protein
MIGRRREAGGDSEWARDEIDDTEMESCLREACEREMRPQRKRADLN